MWNKYRASSLLLVTALGLSLMPVSSFAAAAPALQKAKAAAIIKELPDQRSQYGKTYQLQDGTLEAVLYAKPIHYQDASGKWQEIKPVITPVPGNGTTYQVSQVPYKTLLPDDYREGYSLGSSSSLLKFVPVSAESSKSTKPTNQSLAYPHVWTATNSTISLTDTSLQETLTLQSAEAPTTFSYIIDGDIQQELAAGRLALPDAHLQDSKGTVRSLSQELRQSDGHTYLELKPDLSGLILPVTIQREVGMLPAADSKVQEVSVSGSVYPASDSHGNPILEVGRKEETAAITHLQYDLSPLTGEGTTLADAYLSINVTDAGQAGRGLIQASRHTKSWQASVQSTTYSTLEANGADGIAYGTLNVQSTGVQRIPLLTLVQEWVSGTQPNYGLALSTESTAWLTLSSSSAASIDQRPQLHIRYETTESKKKLMLRGLNTLQLFQYTYDAQNRLQTLVFANGDYIQFTYDSHGNLLRRELKAGAQTLEEEVLTDSADAATKQNSNTGPEASQN